MSLKANPAAVSDNVSADLLRQQLKRSSHWDCPVLDADPGPEQQPPGMLWIRKDLRGCERYRLYDENGSVVTLCGDADAVGAAGTESVRIVYAMVRQGASPDIVTNTSTETFFTSLYTIPGATTEVGDVFRVRIAGVARTDAVSSATLRLKIYLEAVNVGGTGTYTLTAPLTNVPWSFDFDIAVVDLGSPGAAHVAGVVYFVSGSAVSPVYNTRPFNGGAGDGYSFSSNSDADIKISAEWSAADPDHQAEILMFNVLHMRVGGL